MNKKINQFNIFYHNRINLSKSMNPEILLKKISKALLTLSKSLVWNGKLAIGGDYHKKYYTAISSGFLDEKSEILELKKAKMNNFGFEVKQNLCNFGIYFYTKLKKEYIKIFCGNGCVIERTIQNYIEKFVCEND